MSEVNLACTGTALVTSESPSSNQHGLSSYQLQGGNTKLYYTYLLLKFEELPQQYWYYNLLSARYYITLSRNMNLSNNSSISFQPLQDTFDPATVTYDTKPAYYSGYYETALVSNGSGDIEVYQQIKKDGQSSSSVPAIDAISHYAASVRATSALRGNYYCDAYSELATSAKRPYLKITLTDTPASCAVYRVSPEPNARFNVAEPMTFSWRLGFLREGEIGFIRPMADIVQTSADLVWREKTEQEWTHRITVQGDVRSITVPANTFPARDIYWKVEPTLVVYPCYSGDSISFELARPRIYVDNEASVSTGLAGVNTFYPDANIPWNSTFILSYSRGLFGTANYQNLLAQFEPFPSEYNYHAIDNAGMCFRTIISAEKQQSMSFYYLQQSFDSRTVTWNTKPIASGLKGGGSYDNRASTTFHVIDEFFAQSSASDPTEPDIFKAQSKAGCETLRNTAFMLQANLESPNTSEDGARGTFSVHDFLYRRAMVLDQLVTSKPAAVTNASGYVNPHVAQVFRWKHVPNGDYYCVGGWDTVSATFYYRASDAETWTSVSVPAGASEVTLAAETLSSGTYEWKVTATDDQGTTATSEVYTINTTDAAHIATPITPNGSLENGDAAIRFIWQDSSETGAEPGGADLAYSLDGDEWTVFAQPRTSATQYDAPGDTLPPGTLYWRVRSINADGIAGEWSSALSFLCFASPDAPIVAGDGKPLLTITWQSTEQQAYEVILDGVTYGPYFGSLRSFQAPEHLSDGQHSVSVRVQNEYGLWSDPGTVSVTVTNQPGAPITLSGIFDRDAELSWATDNNTGNYLVYRDNLRIGHTAGRSFTDRTCLGYHEWKVIAVLPDGYYTMSNTVNGELSVGLLTIAALSGGSWLELVKSANSDRSVTWSQSQNVSLRQFAGQEYPQVEISLHRSMSASFDVAWTFDEAARAAAFADLIGRAVILKTPCEGVLVGILAGWQRDNTQFFKAYTCTVQRIHWRDYTDADN